MHSFSLLEAVTPGKTPIRPFNAAMAGHGAASLQEAAQAASGPVLTALLRDKRAVQLLEAVFGNSPFLSRLILRDPEFTTALFQDGAEKTLAGIQQELQVLSAAELPEPELARRLRIIRNQAALSIALADIAGLWTLEQVITALSGFAQSMLQCAVVALLRACAKAGDLSLADWQNPSYECGYVILAMGKLGAGELNYSSDVDLIVLFDSESNRYTGKRELADFQIRFTRNLVSLLQDFTEDGYVFRVDLRLRPDPAATPIALPVTAAENYYESTGKGWERAAMIKARPVAGDVMLGQRFLQHIQPFVWRRSLDFAAIHDVYDMIGRIRAHHGHSAIQVAGHNIKLGIGGIREIEFFVQTHQLIAGGRDRELRESSTLGMIELLRRKGMLPDDGAAGLSEAYIYLRTLEHRLQMIGDAQTHTLPATPDGLAHIAAFMGHAGTAAFTGTVHRHLSFAARYFQRLMESGASQGFSAAAGSGAPASNILPPGFQDQAKARAILDRWESFRYRALRTQRAQELLRRLTPQIIQALATTSDPDTALARFDTFLAALPAGVQLLALFSANPKLLDVLAEIMGTAPRLAEMLSRKPALLDAVLSAEFFAVFPAPEFLAADLRQALEPARDYQDVLDIARRWANDRKFQVGVQLLRNLTDGGAAGRALSDIADTLIRILLPRVQAEFALKHGLIPDAGMAVAAMGKLGGRELTFTSDLDLVFIYSSAQQESDGSHPLVAAQYFARLSQRFISALTALTSEGRLYEVDMRLRPSGLQGPIAVSFEAFRQYQQEAAQTWEHMAWTRARLIAGPANLCNAVTIELRRFLAAPRIVSRLASDVAGMRARIDHEHHTSNIWDVKYVRGGLMDAEFITQYLILRHGCIDSLTITGNTIEAIERLRDIGALGADVAARLRAAVILQRDTQQLTRLCLQEEFITEAAPPALRQLMAAQAGAVDFTRLSQRLRTAQRRVYSLYRQLILGAARQAAEVTTED